MPNGTVGALPEFLAFPGTNVSMCSVGHSTVSHTFDKACGVCGDDRPADCVQRRYGRRIVRFVRAHLEAYESAYLNGDGRAASGELKRLDAELRMMPPRHSCTCPSINPRTGIYSHHCAECRKVDLAIQKQEWPADIGRSSAVNAPTPMVLLLDYFSGNMGKAA